MSSPALVRAGLAATLAPLGVPIALAPDQMTPPCVMIGMPSIQYNMAFAQGLDVAEWPVYVVAPRIHDQAAVDQLDAWVASTGAASVRALIQASQTLGGSAQANVVHEAKAQTMSTPGGELPCYLFRVEVWG